MSLKQDIENSFLKSLGNPDDKGNVPELATDLSEAIINFIQQQDFQITEMKSRIEIENLSTTNEIPANIPVSTQLGPKKTIINFFRTLIQSLSSYVPLASILPVLTGKLAKLQTDVEKEARKVSIGGVRVPFNLSNKGSNSGELLTKGYAYIGENSPDRETNENLTKVKLLSVKTGTE